MEISKLEFEKREVREEFIRDNKSGLYTGTNIDGEPVIIALEQGDSMEVMTIRKVKPKWYECVEYDNQGYQVATSYLPV